MDSRGVRPLASAPMLRHEINVIAPAFEPILREHRMANLEAIYGCASGDVITRSGSTEVRRVTLGTGPASLTLFIKKYWVSRPRQLWSGMFRGTFFGCPKARREFQNLATLRAMDLDAPEPVAFGEERKAGWLVRSYLISKGVPDPTPLHEFVRDQLATMPANASRPLRRTLIANLAACTRRLHERRFVHHDYFWRNILLSGGRPDRFFLIDAHKGRRWRSRSGIAARASDLAALDSAAPHFFRRTERLRFFLLYREHRTLDADDKALIRKALEIAGPMRERQLRRVLGQAAKSPA